MKRKIPLYNLSLKKLEARLKAFQDHIPEMLKDIIQSKADIIVSTITKEQLYKQGITGTGERIIDFRPYQPSTIARKRKKHQPYRRVTLKDTGKFHRQAYLVCETDGFYITSRSKVTPFLTKKYGQTIFRLTDQNLTRILNEHIRPEFVKRLKQVTKDARK